MLNPFETAPAPRERQLISKPVNAISRAEYQARRGDLPEHVRNYADRLHASILNFVSKYGVNDISDLMKCVESKRCEMSSAEAGKLAKAINVLHDVLERKELAGLTEVARAGEGGNFYVSEGEVFVVNKYTRQECDPVEGVYEVPESSLSPLNGEYFSLESEDGWYIVGDGQAFAVNPDGTVIDCNGQPADVAGLGDLPTHYSGGKWFHVGRRGGHAYVSAHSKKPAAPGSSDMVDCWTPIYGSNKGQEPLMATEVKIDQGNLYLLHISSATGETTAKISELASCDVLYEGPWGIGQWPEEWRVSQGQVYIKRNYEYERMDFYKNTELIYSLPINKKFVGWTVDKGILYLLLAGDALETRILYKLETPEVL